jgi:transcriptional activator of cad operon
VASLRRLLGDDPRQPVYIATVPRLGYRMVAPVSPWQDQADSLVGTQTTSSPASDSGQLGLARPSVSDTPEVTDAVIERPTARRRPGLKWIVGAAICLALVALAAAFLFRNKVAGNNRSATSAAPAIAPASEKSIAVLAFLDLTEEMNHEAFADGMTEELIDKLSKIPGLRVPPPTSSFYFKGKKVTIADIAKALSVAYVLDGSIRRSGARMRVAARLIRADNGYVVWSETYDRPLDDIIMIQDDIAGEVTKALRAYIDGTPDH